MENNSDRMGFVLIAPHGPKDVLDKFKAAYTYTHKLDVYAKSMEAWFTTNPQASKLYQTVTINVY